MRLFHLIIVLYGIIMLPLYAQSKLTINEALALAEKNNIELHKSRLKIKNAEVNLDASARLPNPEFTYMREDLKNSDVRYDEWSALGSIPINFLWDRWSNIESKEKFIEAQKLLYEQKLSEVKANVKTAYITLDKNNNLYLDINQARIKLNELVDIAKARVDEGDISEYEYKRILIELNKLKLLSSEIELQRTKSENELKLLIGFPGKSSLSTLGIQNNFEIEFDEKVLIQLLIKNRNDLKAASLLIESESQFLSNNKLKAIPQINLAAGYKQQADNMKGSIVQLNFEVPLFNRNQKAIEETEIEISLLEREKIFLKDKIINEAAIAYKNYELNNDLLTDENNIRYEDLFETASLSYLQGETSLIEFIDGLNTYTTGIINNNRIQVNYYKSLFELEKITASTFLNLEEN